MYRIAVDAMGGDFAPKEQIAGAMLAIRNIPDIEIILYGDEQLIKPLLTNSERISVVHAPFVIPMGEKNPIQAIKTNKDTSSMARALQSLRSEEADAVVSSGATQALISGAHILVRRMQGFKAKACGVSNDNVCAKYFRKCFFYGRVHQSQQLRTNASRP